MPVQILRQRRIDVRRTVTRNGDTVQRMAKGQWVQGINRPSLFVPIHTLYKEAEKEAIAPHLPLLSGIKLPLPSKQKCELLTEEELRRMRYADLSDSMSQTFARDMFFFSIYCRGISFTDLAHIRKSDIKGFTLTYISQVLTPPIVTVQWNAAMQAIADRYPSATEYLFPIIKSDDKIMKNREIGRVYENITKALKLIATRCNLSVVPSLKMTKESISARLIM